MSAIPSAWTSNITEEGRLLPERWRVGKFERSTMLKSVVNLIVDDITTIAADLVAEGVDEIDAAGRAAGLWRELIDDAVCRAYQLVLTGERT